MNERLGAWLRILREHKDAAMECQGAAVWLTGTENVSGAPLSAFYYGTLDSYDYVLSQVYSAHTVLEARESTGPRAGLRLLREATSDLVVGELSWPYFRALGDPRFLRVPPVVTHRIALPATWNAVEAGFRKRKTTRDELDKLERFGLSYRTTRERGAIERFYDRMYVPYVTRRHGPGAEIESRDDVVRAAERGTLLEIVRENRVIAAGVLRGGGRRMRFLWLGIENGLDPKVVSAASAALYCYTIRHAIASGCDELNLMYCAFGLNNGVHRYKRKLGARLCNDWRLSQLVLRVTSFHPGVAGFFSSMPLAAGGVGRELTGRILLTGDGISVDDIRQAGLYHACDGLARLTIFSARPLSEEVMTTDYEALDERLPPLELRDLTRCDRAATELCRP